MSSAHVKIPFYRQPSSSSSASASDVFVEQDVALGGTHAALRMLGHSTVVVVVPRGRIGMLAVGRVMSGMRGARVIGDGVEVVDGFVVGRG